jgi:cell division protein FtsZ
MPQLKELKPRIVVCGVGGAGGNAINNMIVSGLSGVDFVVANTDAQALASSRAQRIIQMGLQLTEGLGAGSKPEIGKAAAEETLEDICDHLAGSNMVFLAAGMGGGTGTGAAPVIAAAAREMGILTVAVVTKPFHFESGRRMRVAEAGIAELHRVVDTLIVIPNQNLFRVANEKTTFADAFAMADQVLCSGISCITDLMVKEGLVNLDFADVCSIMSEMRTAMIGTGEATGERRALRAAEGAIANPLFDDTSLKGARGLLISITGGKDLTLYEVDEAASRIRQEVDEEANIIVGAIVEPALEEAMRVSVVATGIDQTARFRIAHMSAQSSAEPVLHTSIALPSPDQPARTPFSTVEADPSVAAVTQIETSPPLPPPVIPFPEPTERPRILDEETRFNPPAIRRLLERFAVAAPERRHAQRASA